MSETTTKINKGTSCAGAECDKAGCLLREILAICCLARCVCICLAAPLLACGTESSTLCARAVAMLAPMAR